MDKQTAQAFYATMEDENFSKSDSDEDNESLDRLIDGEIFDRLDSRGKMIQVRRTGIRHDIRFMDPNKGPEYKFATIDIDHNLYLTPNELKQRANSLAYSQYKKEKREMARRAARKKLLWIMSIVKCKSFVNKLKKRVEERRKKTMLLEMERQ